jgi:hypothetical protein
MEEHVFSLVCKKIPVTLESENGEKNTYFVCELPGPESEQFMDSSKDRFDFGVDEKGKIQIKGIKSFKGTYESLLTLSMQTATGDKVPVKEIRSWPSSVQKALFELAQKVNGMTDESKDEVKNG